MGIYERIRKLYDKAEQEAAEEKARQQRETECLRAASKVANALLAHGVTTVDTPVHGWLIHWQTVQPTPPSPRTSSNEPRKSLAVLASSRPTSRKTGIQYHLGVDGKIYQDGKVINHPANATIDAIEQYLAEIVVKNHLDPELFKDDDIQQG
jgi:hypothetical protein